MEKIVLQPEQIIVPGEYELGNETILQIYFRVFEAGHGDILPPAIVVRIDENTMSRVKTEIDVMCDANARNDKYPKAIDSRKEEYAELFEIYRKTPYALIDGNHKTAAAALSRRPFSALELQSDGDLKEIEKMVSEGELFNFNAEEGQKISMLSLKKSLIYFCIGNWWYTPEEDCLKGFPVSENVSIKYTKTVKQRVEELVSNKELPQYMIKKYLAGGIELNGGRK